MAFIFGACIRVEFTYANPRIPKERKVNSTLGVLSNL